jgi:predicted transposase/invertase (TIGR01784 family)
MYGLSQLKAKTIRSWARVFSEELEEGESYTSQLPTITIAFANGAVEPIEKLKDAKDKIHRLCMIMDKEDCTVFTDAMELHYIDMKAFANAVNEADSININDTEETMFVKWLSVITEKDIVNKSIIENACIEEEEIQMAMTALQRQSEDKIIRQAYQRRKDDIYFYNLERQEDRRLLEYANAEIARLRLVEAELRQQLAATQS